MYICICIYIYIYTNKYIHVYIYIYIHIMQCNVMLPSGATRPSASEAASRTPTSGSPRQAPTAPMTRPIICIYIYIYIYICNIYIYIYINVDILCKIICYIIIWKESQRSQVRRQILNERKARWDTNPTDLFWSVGQKERPDESFLKRWPKGANEPRWEDR